MPGDAGTRAASSQELPEDELGEREEEQAQQPVTPEVAAYVDGKLEQLRRSMQSGDDRTEHRLRNELRDALGSFDAVAAVLKEAGLEIPADVRERASSAIQRQVITRKDEESEAATARRGGQAGPRKSEQRRQAPESEAEDAQVVEGLALTLKAIQEEEGAFVEDKDPEAALIDTDTESIGELIDSVRMAAREKAKRLGLTPGEEESEEEQTPAEKAAAQRRARRPGRAAGKGTGFAERSSISLFREAFGKTGNRAKE